MIYRGKHERVLGIGYRVVDMRELVQDLIHD